MVKNLYYHDHAMDKLYDNLYAARKSAAVYARKHKRDFLHTDFAITVYCQTPYISREMGYVALNGNGDPIWCDIKRKVYSHLINKDGSIRKITSPFQL